MSSFTPSRRGLIAASAWSVPAVVVASSAPAFAASPTRPLVCDDISYLATWTGLVFTPANTSVPNGAGSATVIANPLGGNVPPNLVSDRRPLHVTATNRLNGSRVRGARSGSGRTAYTNMRVSPGSVGGTTQRGLTLLQDYGSTASLPGSRAGHGQTLTLTFTRDVKNLKFTITDLDSSNDQYRDRVWVSQPPANVSAKASGIVGTGTSTDPWRQSSNNASYDPSASDAGNFTLNYGATPISALEIHFWSDQTGSLDANGLQGIFITNLEFRASTC